MQNRFSFSSSTTSCDLLGPFLNRIPSQARLLRHIIVDISSDFDRQTWSFVENSFWAFARLAVVSPAVETCCLGFDPIWLLGLHHSTENLVVFRRINDLLRRSGHFKSITLKSYSSGLGGAQAHHSFADLMQSYFTVEIFDLGWKNVNSGAARDENYMEARFSKIYRDLKGSPCMELNTRNFDLSHI
jgi:hypothetical protein